MPRHRWLEEEAAASPSGRLHRPSSIERYARCACVSGTAVLIRSLASRLLHLLRDRTTVACIFSSGSTLTVPRPPASFAGTMKRAKVKRAMIDDELRKQRMAK